MGTTETLAGRTVRLRWRVCYLAFISALIIWVIVSGPRFSTFSSLYPVVYGTLLFRPPTRVSAAGIRPAGWRARLISWDDIDAIARPTSWATSVIVLLRDETTVKLADLAAAESEHVAGIGGKELRSIRRTTPPPRPATPTQKPRLSETEVERDLQRRAASLAADAEQMSTELDRIRRRRTPSPVTRSDA